MPYMDPMGKILSSIHIIHMSEYIVAYLLRMNNETKLLTPIRSAHPRF